MLSITLIILALVPTFAHLYSLVISFAARLMQTFEQQHHQHKVYF